MRDVIERQTAQLTRLVDDLLDMSRINRGLVELRKEPVALDEIIGRAIETTSALFEERGHQLDVDLPADPLRLEADPARLEQMLANLLNNAARYTEPGGRVWLSAARVGKEAVIRVEDTGIGIRPELLPHMFDLFTQGDRVAGTASAGLGIGLTLVRRLAELHGGSVSVSSPGPGRGSAFLVRLPLHDAVAMPARTASAASRLVGRPRRILVVDDNVDAAVSLALVMKAEGHHVETAHDGPAALEAARLLRPDVVFLDIGLPKGMDGYEVARRLRGDLGLTVVLMAALTGYGQEEDRQRSLAAGFDHHLVKPVDPNILIDMVSGLATPV
jgi:two-component system CheB/CheR fusion protein